MTVLHPKGDNGLTFELKIKCDRSADKLKILTAGTSDPNHFVVEVATKHGCPTNLKYDYDCAPKIGN